jgi:hypothetical protein
MGTGEGRGVEDGDGTYMRNLSLFRIFRVNYTHSTLSVFDLGVRSIPEE